MRLSEQIREQKVQLRELKALIKQTKQQKIQEQIRRYNIRLKRLKDDCVKWLEELGYSVTVEEQYFDIEEIHGEYTAREYILTMDNGRIEYLLKTKPEKWKAELGPQDYHANIPETGWYLESFTRHRPIKMSKDILAYIIKFPGSKKWI